MSAGAGSDYKAQVLAAVNLVELIGRSVALKRVGKDYKGLCPFHQEKTASFKVDPVKQYFYCFGCKASGNAIDFVMKRDRVEFLDALKLLGEQAGIEMPRFGGSKQKTGERQALLEMHSAACAFFEKLLSHPEHGSAARAYLERRGFDKASIQRFQIGLALDSWDALVKGPVGRKFPPQQLAIGGLVKARERGDGFYDTFRNRLIFPIRNENGQVIAFGGRKMPESQDPAKYLNSPETPLFSKSRCVFGVDLARQSMVETRTAVVVEGYTDVVMAHQFGVSNVVSVLGTAMTEQHVALLRRFADRVVLLFDADRAGDAAVDRAVSLFLTQPIEILIASMPQGVDPDEYLLEQEADAFRALLGQAADALSYKWKQLIRQFNESGQDLTGQQKAVEAYLEVLAAARGSGPVDGLRWGSALARVSRLTDIPVDELNRKFRVKRAPRTPSAPQTATAKAVAPANAALSGALEKAERRILGALLLEPVRWETVQARVSPDSFADERHRRLAEIYWEHQRHEGEPVFNEFLGVLRDPALIEIAVETVDEVEQLADTDRVLAESVQYLDRARQVREEQKLLSQLRRTSENPQRDEVDLLRELQAKRSQPDLRRV